EAAEHRAVVLAVSGLDRAVDQGSVAALLAAVLLAGCSESPEARLRKTLATQTTGVIQLPRGLVEISSELKLASDAHDLEIIGEATMLKASDQFQGRAVMVLEGAQRIRLHDFAIDGNRERLARPLDMAPPENAFRVWYPSNGLLADRVEGLEAAGLFLANIVNFPMLISRSKGV